MPARSKVISFRQAWTLVGCGIFVLYVSLRFWRLTSSCLWFDEIFGVHASIFSWTEMLWFVALDLVHPPLFYLFLKSWISIGGDSLFWLRLLPLIFAILTVFPFLYLCREIKSRPSTTCLAFLLLAVNGPLIKYSQEVRMYSLLLFLSAVSFWLFARFYFRGKSIWMLGFVNVLLVYTHYSGWLVILCEVVSILFSQRIKIRPILTMALAAVATSLPWAWAIWKAAAAGSDIGQNIGWIERPNAGQIFEFLGGLFEPFYFRQSNADPAALMLVPAILLVFVAVAGILYFLGRRDETERNTDLLLLIFSTTPVAAALVLSLLLPYSIWGTRHLIFVFIPTTILVARFIAKAGNGVVRVGLISFLSVALLLAFAIFLTIPRSDYIWCTWNAFAADVLTDGKITKKPAHLYVFEDLIAYHFWFALHDNPDIQVALVRGVDGVPNDPAYFLPRGFDGVSVASPDDINDSETCAAFRLGKRRSSMSTDVAAFGGEQPVALFVSRGYEPHIVQTIQVGSEVAYLVKFTKRVDSGQDQKESLSSLAGD